MIARTDNWTFYDFMEVAMLAVVALGNSSMDLLWCFVLILVIHQKSFTFLSLSLSLSINFSSTSQVPCKDFSSMPLILYVLIGKFRLWWDFLELRFNCQVPDKTSKLISVNRCLSFGWSQGFALEMLMTYLFGSLHSKFALLAVHTCVSWFLISRAHVTSQ